MIRMARVAALGLVAVLALSGCLRYNMDITLDSDNTASGTIVTAVQKGIGEQMGAASDEEALAQLFADSPFEDGSDNFRVDDYAEDDYLGKSYSFDGLELDQLNATFSELFSIERVGDQFVVTSESAPVNADEIDQVPSGAESMLSITFPGEVSGSESNGTIDAKTVTWDLFAQTEPISATANATPDSAFPIWLIFVALALLAVLAGIAMVVVVLVRKQKSTTLAPPTEQGPATPAAPPAPQAEQDPAPPAEPEDNNQ